MRLKWNETEYKGRLVSIDSYMNLQLSGAQEYVNQKHTGSLGEVLIRCKYVVFRAIHPNVEMRPLILCAVTCFTFGRRTKGMGRIRRWTTEEKKWRGRWRLADSRVLTIDGRENLRRNTPI